MKSPTLFLPVVILSMVSAGLAHATEYGNAAEAEALLDRAIGHLAVNRQQALSDFSVRGGPFTHRDLYVLCEDMNGKILAHGGNPILVGKETKGSELTAQFIQMASSPAGGGSVEYDWADPQTKKVARKRTLIKRAGDLFCGVGFFK